jgi:hypothetical protein
MGDRQAAAAFGKAIDIAERLGDKPAFCDALFGTGIQFIQVGDYRTALGCAQRACQHIDDLPAATAVANHNAMALSRHLVGDQADARHHAVRALSLGDTLNADARPYWINHRVTARATLASTLWVLGLPDQALKMAHASLDDFLLAGDARSLAYALYHACSVAMWAGDLPAADRFVTMALDHAARHSLAVGHFRARSFAAVLASRRGHVTDKAAQRDAILSDPLCDRPYLDSLATLDEDLVGAEALARAEAGHAGWCAAEILRAKTTALLKNGKANAVAAEARFQRSLDIARRQGALSWELRAATSLARLWGDQGRAVEARDLLTSVLGRFTEGFGTADLVTAQSLLGALSSPTPARRHVKLEVVERRRVSPNPTRAASPRRLRRSR